MQLYQISLLENAYRVDPIPEILHAQAEKEIQLVKGNTASSYI